MNNKVTITTSSKIAALAATIHLHTTKLDEYFISHGISSPTFDINSPASYKLPDDIAGSRNAVLEATDELHMLMLGPVAFLTTLHVSIYPTIQALYRFGFASSFPVGEEATFAQIAETTDLTEQDARRLLRLAMTHRIFKEPRKGFVAHTPISKAIAEQPLLRQYCGFVSEDCWHGNSRVIDATVEWPGSGEPDETGLNLATNSTKTFWQELASDTVRSKRFNDAMKVILASGGLERAQLMERYNWGAAEAGVIVDIGGLRGDICFDIARRYPKVRCVSQDLPSVIDGAEVPRDLVGRVDFVAHDFFKEQPVKAADIYILHWILRHWSDKYCIKILRNLIPALKEGAKVVVSELCLPEPTAVSSYAQRRARAWDLNMKALFNGQERDAGDWARLFEEADARFRFNGVTPNPWSRWAVMEAVWAG